MGFRRRDGQQNPPAGGVSAALFEGQLKTTTLMGEMSWIQRNYSSQLWVAAAALASWSVTVQADYRTYVVRPAINNDAILEGEALPAVCREDEKVHGNNGLPGRIRAGLVSGRNR